MKLVEVDDNSLSTCTNNNNMHIDDSSYSKPRVLSTLDNVMNGILEGKMSDADKWLLYSQALQRYLNHAKINSRKADSNFVSPVSKNMNGKDEYEDIFNFSLDNDMSGINTLRDSLDSISQPVVRSFFEQARQHSISPLEQSSVQPKKKKKKKAPTSALRRLPYRINATNETRKRRAENNLSGDISRIRPCKVNLRRINWESTMAR